MNITSSLQQSSYENPESRSRNLAKEVEPGETSAFMDDIGNEKNNNTFLTKSYADSIDAYLQFDGEVVEKKKVNSSWLLLQSDSDT